MAASVSIIVSSDEPIPVVEYEVSAGASGEIRAADGQKTLNVGQDGSTISFLTVKRVGPGEFTIKCLSGKVVVEIDGQYKKPKKISKGGKVKLTAKNERVLVREQIK